MDCGIFHRISTCIDCHLYSHILVPVETVNSNMTKPKKAQSKNMEDYGEAAESQHETHHVNQDLLNQTVTAFISYVREDVTDMKKSLNSLTDENLDLKKQVASMEKRLHFSENQIVALQNKIAAQHEVILDLQCRSMRDNLVFHGIPEDNRESWEITKTKVVQVLKDKMKMPAAEVQRLSIDRAHRIGSKGDRHRPIVVRFMSTESKSSIFKYVQNLKDHREISVQEQFPPEVSERRKRLLPLHREAKSENKNVRWAVDKLIIDGKTHTAADDSCSLNPQNLQFNANIVHTAHLETDGSTFIGHATQVSRKDDIPEVIGTLLQDKSLNSATHNAYAYRIKSGNTTIEGCKDDQEHGAGTSLLDLLRQKNEVNVMTIVSRWCGSKLMGPRRFQVYKDCANSAVELL